MRILIAISLLAIGLPLTSSAAIYKFIDENGHTVFADQPGPNAEKIEKRDVQTIKTHKVRPTTTLTNPSNAQGKKTASYDEFKITKPTNDENIRANDGELNVDLKISPKLNQKLGHEILLLLDGKPVSKPETKTAFTLHGVERGQHSLSANIVDKTGSIVLSTQTITIHIKRFSLVDKVDGDNDNPESPIVSPVKRAPIAPRAPMAPRAPQAH